MLVLGSLGMARELFLEPKPNLVRVGICMGLMLGPAAIWVWWRARNPESTPSEPGSPSPQSHSQSRG